MTMKSSESPRRIYTRNGVVHVCFEGKTYAPAKGETALDMDYDVVCAHLESDGGKARIEVTQKKAKKAAVKEQWRSVQVPRFARTG